MILILAVGAILVQLLIFKYFYPYASYIHGDSFSYLKAAHYNLDVNTYMVGYSRFLRLFSVFTKSDTMLVAFQYLFMQTSILFLLFSIFYFYRPGRVVQIVLLCFMVFNPLFLHLANLISSDGFFLALSVIWFTLLLWILHRPSKEIILVNAIVLFIAFTVRYNALIYPFISAGAILLSRVPRSLKFAGIGVGMLLCGLFVFYTSYKYKKITGYWQYSPFSGWQFANNAMYAYRYVDSAKRKPVDEKFKVLDNMIREYFDSTRDVKKHPQETLMASTVYMWTPGMSLFKYRDQLFKKKDSTASELKKWASMGSFYKEYGLHIIKKYPFHFARYFIWYNAMKYYAPPVEFLEHYNSGKNDVLPIAQNWFDYNSTTVSTRMKSKEVWILGFYPILSGIINVIMLCVLICYLSLKGWQTKNNFRIGILMGGTVWLLNAGFTIIASSAALRFQSFPLLITIIFASLLLDWLWSIANTRQETTKSEDSSLQDIEYKAMA
jgi:hypothetical protein